MRWTTVLWSLQIPFWQQEPFKNAEVLLQYRPTAMWVWAKGFLLLSFSLFKGKRFTAVILDKLSTLRNPSTQMSSEGEPLTLCGSLYFWTATRCLWLNKYSQWSDYQDILVHNVQVHEYVYKFGAISDWVLLKTHHGTDALLDFILKLFFILFIIILFIFYFS